MKKCAPKPNPNQLPHAPVRGKRYLLDAGVSQGRLAARAAANLKKAGHRGGYSRPMLSLGLNKGYWGEPGRIQVVKDAVRQAAREMGVRTQGFFSPEEYKDRRVRMPRRHGQRSTRMQKTARPPRAARKKGEEEPMHIYREDLLAEECRHFGLEADPFEEPQVSDIFLGPVQERALEQAERWLKRMSMVALLGRVGSGKSTLLRHLIHRLRQSQAPEFVLIYPNCMDREQLTGNKVVSAIIRTLAGGQYRMPPSSDARNDLAVDLLQREVDSGHVPCLVIDEAHDIPVQTFIHLKRLWDSGPVFKLLSILVAGQGYTLGSNGDSVHLGLKDLLLHHPDLKEVTERMHLVELSSRPKNLAAYLAWRFHSAGGDLTKAVEPEALKLLANRAYTPQEVNNLCIKAMKQAYRDGEPRVLTEHVAEI